MSGQYWHQIFDSSSRSYVIVMPDSDGRQFKAGDRLVSWRAYYSDWFRSLIRHIGDEVELETEYPSGIYVEIVPVSDFVLDVKSGLYKHDEICYSSPV